jgi:hypothetical protein
MNSTSPLARFNFPLLGLWIASAAAIVGGWVLVQSGNAAQADLYTSQSGDYAMLFDAQSTATTGGQLIGVGVLGLLLALVVHAVARSRANAVAAASAGLASAAVVDDEPNLTEPVLEDDAALRDDTLDEHARVDAPAAAPAADVDFVEPEPSKR